MSDWSFSTRQTQADRDAELRLADLVEHQLNCKVDKIGFDIPDQPKPSVDIGLRRRGITIAFAELRCCRYRFDAFSMDRPWRCDRSKLKRLQRLHIITRVPVLFIVEFPGLGIRDVRVFDVAKDAPGRWWPCYLERAEGGRGAAFDPAVFRHLASK